MTNVKAVCKTCNDTGFVRKNHPALTLKGVFKITSKGRTYYYAGRGGPRIHGEPGSPEFIVSYSEAFGSKCSNERETVGIEETAMDAKVNHKLMLSPIDKKLKGCFIEVSKHELCVPWDDYQRDRTTSARAKEIAIGWNWAAFSTLTIFVRPDGSHVVADGGTRLSAAFLRPDIDLIPCMLYDVSDPKTEAEIFRIINMNRDKPKVHEIHKSELFEGRDMAIEAQNYIDELARAGVAFDSLARLKRKIERTDREHTLRLLPVFKKIAAGRALSAKCFTGMIFVERALAKNKESLSHRPYIGRLCRIGAHGIDTAITGHIPFRSGGGTAKVYGQVIMNLLKIKA